MAQKTAEPSEGWVHVCFPFLLQAPLVVRSSHGNSQYSLCAVVWTASKSSWALVMESEQKKKANIKTNIYVRINICVHFLENAYLNNGAPSCALHFTKLSRQRIDLIVLVLLNSIFHYIARVALLKYP